MSTIDQEALPSARLPASAAFTDAVVIARRNILTIIRTPQLLVFSTIQPVMFVLLFRYVFGGAINVPAESYASWLLPGIFVQTVVFGSTTAAVALAYDLKGGIIDRFRSLPMARSAVLAGRTAADAMRNLFVICLMILVGYAVDFRFEGGFFGAIGAMAIALLFGYAFSWFFALVGLLGEGPRDCAGRGLHPALPVRLREFHLRLARDDALVAAVVRRAPAGDEGRECRAWSLTRHGDDLRRRLGAALDRGDAARLRAARHAAVPQGLNRAQAIVILGYHQCR